MNTAGGFQGLGPQDFAQCAGVFYRLPAHVRARIHQSGQEMLTWMICLLWKNTHEGRGSGSYLFVSQLAWAKTFGKSRWTAERALDRLAECGLITRKRKLRTKAGEWKPNLVTITKILTSALDRYFSKFRRLSPGSKSATQVMRNVYKREKTAPSSGVASHSPSLSALRLREGTDWWTKTKAKWDAENRELPTETGSLSALFAKALAKP